jgi:hypothetical protein
VARPLPPSLAVLGCTAVDPVLLRRNNVLTP